MATLNLTLKPAQIELVAKPGTTLTQAYSVINNTDTSLVLTTQVLPWQASGTDGSLTYTNVPTNPNLEFSLNNADLRLGQTFILKPHETRQLVLKIQSADSVSLSDAYYTFFVSQELTNSFNTDSSLTSTSARLGSHILLSSSTSETPVSQFSVKSLSISPQFKDILFPQLKINAEIFNSSKYFAKTTGKLTITKNNLVIKELDLFPHNVLSNNSRQINCVANDNPVPCVLDPPFWPGSYTATITLDPALSAAPVSQTFYVFPYSLLLLLLLISSITLTLRRLRKPKQT